MVVSRIGNMALYDREDDTPDEEVALGCAATNAVSEESCENDTDALVSHQFSVTIAAADVQLHVPTVSGELPRRRGTWRSIVGMSWHAQRIPSVYKYEYMVCIVNCTLVAPRVLCQPVVHRKYAHPVRCEALPGCPLYHVIHDTWRRTSATLCCHVCN